MAQESAISKEAAADYDAVMKQMTALRDDMVKLTHTVQTIASTRGHAIAQDMSQGMTDAANYLGRKGHEADERIEGAVAAAWTGKTAEGQGCAPARRRCGLLLQA